MQQHRTLQAIIENNRYIRLIEHLKGSPRSFKGDDFKKAFVLYYNEDDTLFSQSKANEKYTGEDT